MTSQLPLADHSSMLPDFLTGHIELEHTDDGGIIPHRLPTWARTQLADPQIDMVEAQPAGVRLEFRTTASVVEVDAAPTRFMYRGLPPRPDGLWDVVVDGVLVAQESVNGGTRIVLDPRGGAPEVTREPAGTVRVEVQGASGAGSPEGRESTVQIWLPTHEKTEVTALRADAPVVPLGGAAGTEPAAEAPSPGSAPAGSRCRWVHHGSSISHGSNATSPTTTWIGRVAREQDLDVLNLGFGGSMMLDQAVARTIRDAEADLISIKVGINLVNADLMRMRAFRSALHGFLDTVREGHPETPLLVVSAIHCAIHEEVPGPGAFDPAAAAEGRMAFMVTGDAAEVPAGKLTLQTIRAEVARVCAERQEHDPHLFRVDGLDLFGAADEAELPFADNLHPGPEAHARIAERFRSHTFGPGGAFAVAR
ncbi:SGNH/GDSL hydrolase family protein [Brevibacterium litoralis]|uniref:SGNH/GDSL hydrolase family protein n=1 Tax=Brevibacterium litoralis TaxID=3138935 RepID=UPI0032ED40DC